jgi:hypothetical protein
MLMRGYVRVELAFCGHEQCLERRASEALEPGGKPAVLEAIAVGVGPVREATFSRPPLPPA